MPGPCSARPACHTIAWICVEYIPAGQLGKVWVAFGKKEEFGFDDLLTFGNTVTMVRSFHEISGPGGICPLLRFLPIASTLLPLPGPGPFFPPFPY